MTKTAFLAALRRRILETYPWAQDAAKLDNFMTMAQQTIAKNGRNLVNFGSASGCAYAAWREIGGGGVLTYKALRALPARSSRPSTRRSWRSI